MSLAGGEWLKKRGLNPSRQYQSLPDERVDKHFGPGRRVLARGIEVSSVRWRHRFLRQRRTTHCTRVGKSEFA
eukprot:3941537-Rhodomonas_salina.6